MKNKLLTIALASVLAMSTLVGCGKEDNKNVEVQTETAVEDAVTEEVAEIPAEGAETVEVVEEESNTVDMTIEEYISYIHSKSSDSVKEFIFGVQTQNDAEHTCSNTYDVQLTNEGLCAVDIRNMAYSFAGTLSDENSWFMPPVFALNGYGLLDESAMWSDVYFEYDSSINATVMKSADGTALAYFGEASIVNEYIIFTTHFDDGDYVVYVNTYYDRVSYPTKDADGKEINFVTHH